MATVEVCIVIRAYLKAFLLLSGLILGLFVAASGQDSPDFAAKLLSNQLGGARAVGPVSTQFPDQLASQNLTSSEQREYATKDGRRFTVDLFVTRSDSQAFSRLANFRARFMSEGRTDVTTADVGTDAFYVSDGGGSHLHFFKGNVFASVVEHKGSSDIAPLLDLGRALAGRIDKGEGEIPTLVKHLPDWPNVHPRTFYFATKEDLMQFNNRQVFDVLNFEGGAEAAIAPYQGASLAIVEFYTPQLATDNDRRIVARIAELRSQGQAVPSAYRRVGNYSVFVFDAANEQAANQLLDQVQYQQVVQWLGKNPNLYDQATSEFTRTTLGVFVAVVKASGLALLMTFLIGGVVGAILFRLRRKQQRAVSAYSDAGGMLRLNLDEMTPRSDPARLLGPGN